MQELIAKIKETDAGQFELLVRVMSQIATDTFKDSDDEAWEDAAEYLNKAARAISQRKGN